MKLALIGVGLIGGSFALAMRGRFDRIVGFDTSAEALRHAMELSVIDTIAESPAGAVNNADVVMIATPVGSIRGVLRHVVGHLSSEAIITDVGSTKAGLIDDARRELGSAFARFVPGHPIAGSEHSGVLHASSSLFQGKHCVLVPTPETGEKELLLVESLWREAGCCIERMTAEEHDRVFAMVSHLPHLLAFALVRHVASAAGSPRLFSLAGAGFRDFTRIAASSPLMWRDICLFNQGAIAKELVAYRQQVASLEHALAKKDGAALGQMFAQASQTWREFFSHRQE